jgi:hypothetical protein
MGRVPRIRRITLMFSKPPKFIAFKVVAMLSGQEEDLSTSPNKLAKVTVLHLKLADKVRPTLNAVGVKSVL